MSELRTHREPRTREIALTGLVHLLVPLPLRYLANILPQQGAVHKEVVGVEAEMTATALIFRGQCSVTAWCGSNGTCPAVGGVRDARGE